MAIGTGLDGAVVDPSAHADHGRLLAEASAWLDQRYGQVVEVVGDQAEQAQQSVRAAVGYGVQVRADPHCVTGLARLGSRRGSPGNGVAVAVVLDAQPSGLSLLDEPGVTLALGDPEGLAVVTTGPARSSDRGHGGPNRLKVIDHASLHGVPGRGRPAGWYATSLTGSCATRPTRPAPVSSRAGPFLALDTPGDVHRRWTATSGAEKVESPDAWLRGLMRASVLVIPCSSEQGYLSRYAEPGKDPGRSHDAGRWHVPYWHMDTAMATLLTLQTAVDEGFGACWFGIPRSLSTPCVRSSPSPSSSTRSAIALGHRRDGAEEADPAGSPDRRPLGEVVHRGSWR